MPRIPDDPIGWLDQTLAWQVNELPPATVTALTQTTGIATAITEAPHGFLTADQVGMTGAADADYNGSFLVTVVDDVTFTYRVSLAAPPATSGPIVATYLGDGLGGRRDTWTTKQTIPAEVRAVSGLERIQAQAIQAAVLYRVRTRRLPITAQHRFVWDDGVTGVVILMIVAVLRIGHAYLIIDCTEGKPDEAA